MVNVTKNLIIISLMLPITVCAQFTISGRVLNIDNARPVSNVNAFLNNTAVGCKTEDDGIFKLQNIKPGKYDLIISSVGFSTFSEPITVENANVVLRDIYLQSKVLALNEVKITSREGPDRQRNFELFKVQFLGVSDLAKACKIVNPELLDLSYDEKTKTLTAKSVDFLIIENNALGYRIKYLLSNFNYDENAQQFLYEGSVFFEKLKGNAAQEVQWEKSRKDVYANSITHFLRAALNNKLTEEGFSVLRFLKNPERPADSLISEKIRKFTILKDEQPYRDSLSYWVKKSKLPKLLPRQVPVSLTSEDVIEKTNKPGLFAFSVGNDALYIVYNKAHQYNATSLSHLLDQDNISSTLVFFNSPFAFFDRLGAIANPESLSYAGVWANKRLAELLPLDYEPPQTGPLVDSTVYKKIDSTLMAGSIGYNLEKTYIHFDKPYYAAGDTIYFKAYITDLLYKPTATSTILNVELIGPANNICSTIKLKIMDGTVPGDFALADTLKSGRYRLRAYTNVMRNDGDEYFFDQDLFIANEPRKGSTAGKKTHFTGTKDEKAILSSKPARDNNDVQFFPEGGNLVNGIPSKIAFKAINPDGLGVELKGTVTDEQGNQAGTFASQHLGMGVFTLTPQPGKKYKANITYADNSTTALDLQGTDNTGFTLHIDNSDPRSVTISVAAGQQNHVSTVYLLAQSGGHIWSYIPGKLVDKHFTATIPKDQFPEGIVQFTLFSANGEPMNERIAFIRNPGQLNLKLASADSIYHAREKVKIDLTVRDKYNQPLKGNFSVAVTDETRVPVDEDSESTILAHLLLASDLKGYVEKPNYYFLYKNRNAVVDLDVLMLTQGYHRFEWKQILNSKFQAAAFDPEKATAVSGKITNLNGKPVPYGKVSLTSVSHVFFYLDTVADAGGKFVFKHLPEMDSMRYMIQATDKQVRKNTLIEIDKVKSPKVTGNKNVPDGTIKEGDNIITYLKFSTGFHQEQLKQGINKHAIELKEVEIKEKTQKKYLHHSDNLNGAGVANDVITADQLPPGSLTFKDAIIGHLHGIQYNYGNFYYGFFPTLVMIDGIEIPSNIFFVGGKLGFKPGPTQADVLNTLSVSDIASVEIITDASLAAIYGVRGGGGVILVTTKRGDDVLANVHFKPAFAYYSPVGYYKARVFYSPKYDLPKTNTTFTDLRTTIYWNPNIITDESGNASFEFFNADTKGTYRIVVEGIDVNGHLGRQVYRYKVE